MIDNSENIELRNSVLLNDSNLNIQSNNLTNDAKTINYSKYWAKIKDRRNYYYLCPKYHIFPFIEFNKSKKYIKFTCSCYNNKEILIKDLFDKSKNYITINDLSNTSFLLSSNIIDYDNYEGFKCKEYNLNYKYYCKTCLLNIYNA